MIKIFYSEVPDFIDESVVPFLSEYRQKRLNSITNEAARRESICTELLLEKAVYPAFQRPLPILTGECGKPYFPNSKIHFSISHSGGWVACAIGNMPLGLDIQEKKGCDIRIAERYFTGNELAYIRSSNNPDAAFLEVWTKKESRVKASGLGLKQGLSTFSVFDKPDEYSYTVIDFLHFALCVPGENTVKIDITEIKLL